jgi:hypothetical protein
VASGHFVRVHVDKALVSMQWCTRFPLVAVRHLSVVKFDHCPILLSCVPNERSVSCPKPFRYELMWKTNKGLRSLIQQVWKDRHHCNSVKDMKNMLLHLGGELRSWGENTFGMVRRELQVLKKKLEQMRSDPTRNNITKEEQKVVE